MLSRIWYTSSVHIWCTESFSYNTFINTESLGLKTTLHIKTINSLGMCISQCTGKFRWCVEYFYNMSSCNSWLQKKLCVHDTQFTDVLCISTSIEYFPFYLKMMRYGAFVQHTSPMHIYVKNVLIITISMVCSVKLYPWCM